MSKIALIDYKELSAILDQVVNLKNKLTSIGDKLETDYEASGEQKLIPLIDGIFSARDCLKESEHYISNL